MILHHVCILLLQHHTLLHCCSYFLQICRFYLKNSLMLINQGHDSKSECTINITEYVFITCPP